MIGRSVWSETHENDDAGVRVHLPLSSVSGLLRSNVLPDRVVLKRLLIESSKVHRLICRVSQFDG